MHSLTSIFWRCLGRTACSAVAITTSKANKIVSKSNSNSDNEKPNSRESAIVSVCVYVWMAAVASALFFCDAIPGKRIYLLADRPIYLKSSGVRLFDLIFFLLFWNRKVGLFIFPSMRDGLMRIVWFSFGAWAKCESTSFLIGEGTECEICGVLGIELLV